MAAEETAAEEALPSLRARPADSPPRAGSLHSTGPAPLPGAGPAPAPVDEPTLRARIYAALRAFCAASGTAALPAPAALGEPAPRVLLSFRGGVVDACDFLFEVASYGGVQAVDASKLWSAVGAGLGLTETTDFFVAIKKLYEDAPLSGAHKQRMCVRAVGRALRCPALRTGALGPGRPASDALLVRLSRPAAACARLKPRRRQRHCCRPGRCSAGRWSGAARACWRRRAPRACASRGRSASSGASPARSTPCGTPRRCLT